MTVHNPAFHLVFYQMKQKQPSMEFFTSRKPSKMKVSPMKGQVSVKYISDFGRQSKVVPVHHKPVALSDENRQASQ